MHADTNHELIRKDYFVTLVKNLPSLVPGSTSVNIITCTLQETAFLLIKKMRSQIENSSS